MRSKKGIIVSDFHCGAMTGLTPPDSMKPKFKALSMPLWESFVEIIEKIGDVDILIGNGDLVDGEGKKNHGIEQNTTNPYEQAEMAIECLDMITCKKRYFTAGTPFHVATNYRFEKKITDHYGTELLDTLRLRINDIKINVRHKVPTSSTAYGEPSQLFKEVVRGLITDMNDNIEPADVYVRSHAHQFWEVRNGHQIGIITPSWQIPDSIYGNNLCGHYYDMGLIEFEIGETFWYKEHLIPVRFVRPRGYIDA